MFSGIFEISSAVALMAVSISCSLCIAVMKNRSRDDFAGTAG